MGCFSSKQQCRSSCCSCCGCCGCCIPAGSVLYEIDPLPRKQEQELAKAIPCMPSVPGACLPAPTIADSNDSESQDEGGEGEGSGNPPGGVALPCLPTGLALPLGQAQGISCFNMPAVRALLIHLRTKGYAIPQNVVNTSDGTFSVVEPGDFASIATQSAVSSLYSAVTALQASEDEEDDAASFCSVPSTPCSSSIDQHGAHAPRAHVHAPRGQHAPPMHMLSDSNLPMLTTQPGTWATGAHAQHGYAHASHHHPHHHVHTQHQHHTSLLQNHQHGHHHAGAQHPALEAFKRGSLGFSFSGGGFFFPYHLGVVIQLRDMGIITPTTPLAGASCGSIIVACVNAGMDLHGLVPQLLEFASDCRTHGTAGRLRFVIEHFMRRALPADAAERCRGHTFLSLTKVFPYLRPVVISDYSDKEDLVGAIATSCHIPAYNDGSFMARFRDQYWVDGGLVRHIPTLPLDSGASWVAGISCVPFKFLESLPGVQRLKLLRSLAVSPDMFYKFPFGWHEVGGLVLAPAEDPVLLKMVEMGKRDILRWASVVGLTGHLAGSSWVPRPLPLTTTTAPSSLHLQRSSTPPSSNRAGSTPLSPAGRTLRASPVSGGGAGSRSMGGVAEGHGGSTGLTLDGAEQGQTSMTPSQTQVVLTGVLSQLGIEVDEEQWFDAQEEAAAAAHGDVHALRHEPSNMHELQQQAGGCLGGGQ